LAQPANCPPRRRARSMRHTPAAPLRCPSRRPSTTQEAPAARDDSPPRRNAARTPVRRSHVLPSMRQRREKAAAEHFDARQPARTRRGKKLYTLMQGFLRGDTGQAILFHFELTARELMTAERNNHSYAVY